MREEIPRSVPLSGYPPDVGGVHSGPRTSRHPSLVEIRSVVFFFFCNPADKTQPTNHTDGLEWKHNLLSRDNYRDFQAEPK